MASIDVLGRIEASVEDGGWQASGAVFGDADRLDFYQQIEVWFDLYTSSGWENQPRAAFNGHLLPDPWEKIFQSSEAPFSAFTAQEFLKRGEIQGIFFKSEASPANDHQITNMTLADIVEHCLGKTGEYGHCNLVEDVWPEGIITLNIDSTNSSAAVDEYEVKQGNFWRRLQEIAEIDFYLLYVDKSNQLNYIPHPMFGATLPDPVLTITSSLLLEPLTVERLNTEQIGQVKIQGITPRGLQITGKYPTDPDPGPIITRLGYLATADTLMATIAERVFKFENRGHRVTAVLPGAIGLMLDLLDRVAIIYSSAADGISWTSKYFWIHQIKVEAMTDFTAKTILILEAENA
jgi:hypothetical protein